MDEKLTNIKSRILKFTEFKLISVEKFCKNAGVSYSNFKGKSLKSEIGGENLTKILTTYKEINPNWLITGEGEMLRKDRVSIDSIDLASFRKEKGFTQVQFAEKLQISQPYLSEIEKGIKPITTELIKRLTQEFGTEILNYSYNNEQLVKDSSQIRFKKRLSNNEESNNDDMQKNSNFESEMLKQKIRENEILQKLIDSKDELIDKLKKEIEVLTVEGGQKRKAV